MATHSNYVFNHVECFVTKAGCVVSSSKCTGQLSIIVRHMDSPEELNALPVDEKNIVFDNCICEYEFVFEADHKYKQIRSDGMHRFVIKDSFNMIDQSIFDGLMLSVNKVLQIEGTKQKYFYSGAKIGPAIVDKLKIFRIFEAAKFISD